MKKRIAWFSPDDANLETISGYFTATLLPYLKEEFEISLFSNDFKEGQEHFLQAAKIHKQQAFDLFVYQLENDSRLNFSRIHTGLIPGLSIFHHFNFLDFGPEPILNSPWKKIITKFLTEEEWPERGAKFFQQGPAAHRESAFALQALFTNPINVSDFKNQINLRLSERYNLPSCYLPCPVRDDLAKVASSNDSIAYCGKPDIASRAHKLLEAIADTDYKLNWLVNADEAEKAQELIKEFEVENVNLIINRNPAAWEKVLADSSIAMHLQVSGFEQPAPYLQMSICSGITTVVSDYGFTESMSDDLIIKVSAGDIEAASIKEILYSQPQVNLEDYGRESFQASAVAKQLINLINSNMETYKNFYQDWTAFQQEANKSLIDEIKTDSDIFSWDSVFKTSFQELGWS